MYMLVYDLTCGVVSCGCACMCGLLAGKWMKLGMLLLQLLVDVAFVACWVPVFDYLLFPLDCNFTESPAMHEYWPDKRESGAKPWILSPEPWILSHKP